MEGGGGGLWVVTPPEMFCKSQILSDVSSDFSVNVHCIYFKLVQVKKNFTRSLLPKIIPSCITGLFCRLITIQDSSQYPDECTK